jgi:hypothetical protein
MDKNTRGKKERPAVVAIKMLNHVNHVQKNEWGSGVHVDVGE